MMNNKTLPDPAVSRTRGSLFFTSLLLALLAANPAAAGDPYLDMLEMEAADSTEAGGTSELKQRKREVFEQLLKEKRPAVYQHYTELSDTHKMQVVDDFAEKKRLSRSSSLIAELYFKK